MRKVISLLMIAFAITMSMYPDDSYAQDNQLSEVTIYFRTGQSNIVLDYMNNEASLKKLEAILVKENIPNIESIDINAYASPEGPMGLNSSLINNRALSVKQFITEHYPEIPSKKIESKGIEADWNTLRKLVEQDTKVPNREQVLNILNTDSFDPSTKKAQLMALGNGSWNYMLKNLFPELRVVTVITVSLKPKASEPTPVVVIDMVEAVVPAEQQVPEVVEPVVIQTVETFEISDTIFRKPIFALKTNLLYDALTALNIELEVPIGNKWSIAGEYIFPWWLWKNKQTALETLSGNLELRYWLGDREKHDIMTGWFAGVYGGGGYYDLERKKKGYQGEFYSVGLTAGFTHKIARNLRMEYSLGLGYLGTKYRKYEACYFPEDNDWHLIRTNSGNEKWIGPTKVKISLVWMFNKNYPAKRIKK